MMMKSVIVLLMVLLLHGEERMSGKIPIIYSEHYDIGLAGIEKLHPFDTKKHGKVYKLITYPGDDHHQQAETHADGHAHQRDAK